MENMDNNLLDRIRSVKALKDGKNSHRIQEKLKVLHTDLAELNRIKLAIKDDASYKKYENKLNNLVEIALEQITAPNVEDFITWVNSIGIDSKYSLDLKEYLVKNYNDSTNNYLDSIINNSKYFSPERSIFTKLLKSAELELKIWISGKISEKDTLSNNMDDLLDGIDSFLKSLATIEEINYTDIRQLYSPAQVDRNIMWYEEIIQSLLTLNQTMSPIDESEMEKAILSKIKRRILDVKKCIEILDNTNLAIEADKIIQEIFIKYQTKMIEYEGGIANNLYNFIENYWSTIENNYTLIRTFCDSKIEIEPSDKWEQFISGEIKFLVIEYKTIIENIALQYLKTYEAKGITDYLSKHSTIVNSFHNRSSSVQDKIINEFNNTLSEYEAKKLPQLNRLMNNFPTLQGVIDEIVSLIEGLKNGMKNIESEPNLIQYLKSDFELDLRTFNKISDLFKTALKESGMEEHLIWLDNKINDGGNLLLEDFEDTKIIKVLLENGLIKTKIEKTF